MAKKQKQKQKDIIIANPMYDVVFIRLDFVATIRTNDGEEKKILIELQQSPEPYDIFRFRTYIGEQYTNKNNIVAEDDKLVKVMPIVAIYILGFQIEGVSQIAVKVKRSGYDIIDGGDVEIKDPLFEALTHDAYFLQISRIKKEMYSDWDNCSELLKILSVFEQNYFVDKKYFKKYPYPITNKIIEKMVNTLERIAADPKTRRAMQEEEFAALNLAFWKNVVTRKDNIIAQMDNALAQKENALAQKEKENAELRRLLGLN